MSIEFVIRKAVPDDAAGVIAILNPIIEDGRYTMFDTPFTLESERTYIEKLTDRDSFLVALRTNDNAVVGFQSMSPLATFSHAFDHVGVMGTYVDQSVRRQGVARRLFPATFDAARSKGYEKIFTYIRADNPVALAAYQKHGFRVIGTAERHAKLQHRYVDVLLVERQLQRI